MVLNLILYLALRTLTWDPSLDLDTTHYEVYSKHLRPVWGTCMGTDGALMPCVDHYDVISEVGPVLVSAEICPLPSGPSCSLGLEFPLTSELRVGDIQFFKLSSVRSGCSGVTALPPR